MQHALLSELYSRTHAHSHPHSHPHPHSLTLASLTHIPTLTNTSSSLTHTSIPHSHPLPVSRSRGRPGQLASLARGSDDPPPELGHPCRPADTLQDNHREGGWCMCSTNVLTGARGIYCCVTDSLHNRNNIFGFELIFFDENTALDFTCTVILIVILILPT